MTTAHQKLRDIDEKLAMLGEAQTNLTRLAGHLLEQRRRINADPSGAYAQMVQVSGPEALEQVEKVQKLLMRLG